MARITRLSLNSRHKKAMQVMPLCNPPLICDPPHAVERAARSSLPKGVPGPQDAARLGKREREVLEIVWADGSGTVGQVSRRLPISLAYTTVMTTLDRLFKKGLLHRVKRDRAFLYSPAATSVEVESQRARALICGFFEGKGSNADVLLSCLVDAIGRYDDEMLQRMEDKIRVAKLRSKVDVEGQKLARDQGKGQG